MQPVKLYICTTDEIGKRNYAVADLKKQPERGVYYLRITVNGKRRWKSVGKSLKLALMPKPTSSFRCSKASRSRSMG